MQENDFSENNSQESNSQESDSQKGDPQESNPHEGIFYESSSVEDTMFFACEMAKKAKPGDIICLCGQLGVGKTVFAQGYAKGLGISDYVNSPTFSLMQVYDTGRLPLYHFDLYRLLNQTDQIDINTLDDIGFSDYLDGDGVCLVEWAEYGYGVIPDGAHWVEIREVEIREIGREDNAHIGHRHIRYNSKRGFSE